MNLSPGPLHVARNTSRGQENVNIPLVLAWAYLLAALLPARSRARAEPLAGNRVPLRGSCPSIPVTPALPADHLQGDPSLATEILLGPPPLASIQQAGVLRKDHKKAMHFAMKALSAAPADLDGARRKRARLDKG